MSVMTESAIMNTNHKFMDSPLDISTTASDSFTGLSANPESIMVDPRLAMPYSSNLSDKHSEPPFSMSPSIWDTQLDGSMPLFGQQSDVEKPQGTKDNGDVEADAASSVTHGSGTTTRKSSRTSSHSSIPSIASAASSSTSQSKKRARRSTRKKPQQLPSPEEEEVSDKEPDSKRSKYLERNRVAASKCRQKKKEWVHDLEETKGALESKHLTLRQEYNELLQEVSQMKSFLMAHAGCNDQNIDQWIEVEARRFVQRTSDVETLKHRLSGSPPLSAIESQNQSPTTSLQPFASTASPDALQLSAPVKIEDINFDHMPDDMFA